MLWIFEKPLMVEQMLKIRDPLALIFRLINGYFILKMLPMLTEK